MGNVFHKALYLYLKKELKKKELPCPRTLPLGDGLSFDALSTPNLLSFLRPCGWGGDGWRYLWGCCWGLGGH
jgi:hypothetical protein